MIRAIRQEILSGVRTPEQFERIQEELRAFTDLELAIEDYELAAKFSNLCRRNGVQGSNTDFLICAVEDFPRHQLCQGDVATIVDRHPVRHGEDGYSLEVFNAVGETIAVLVVAESQIEPLMKNEVLHIRVLDGAI